MTTLREAAQQALEALEGKRFTACGWRSDCDKAITALRAALKEPVQEPVAWWHRKSGTFTSGNLISKFDEWTPLYTAPPQRRPLTEEEIALIVADCSASAYRHDDFSFARAIERAHGIGGSRE